MADVRVWAPACRTVDLAISAGEGAPERLVKMEPDGNGCFRASWPNARAGSRYWFRLDGDQLRPDPASRWQPDGPHKASALVDPRAFPWTDADGRD